MAARNLTHAAPAPAGAEFWAERALDFDFDYDLKDVSVERTKLRR